MSFFDIIKKLISPFPSSHLRVSLSVQDREAIKRKWADIEQNMKIGRPSNFKTAILDADKLLDHVLKLLGFRGETMAERMKSISRNDHEKDFFDDMWGAHKVRNEMVHNMEYEVMDFEAKRAVDRFKRVLRELGVL